MHNLFAGFMGFLMGFGSFFHGGNVSIPHTQAQANQANVTPTASSSGNFRGRGMMKLPQGERPFFGTVTNVNGSTLTVQMQMPIRRFRSPSMTPTPSTSPAHTVTITLDSSTKYTGGSQSDITTNTKIAGIGKVNSDGSITALQVSINPTPSTGSGPMMRRFNGQGRRDGDDHNVMYGGNNPQ